MNTGTDHQEVARTRLPLAVVPDDHEGPKRPAITVSRIKQYLACARHYAFEHEEGIVPAFEPAARAFGQVMHKVLEWVHHYRSVGGYPRADQAADVFRSKWFDRPKNGLRYLSGFSAKVYEERGAELIARYVDACADDAVLAVEPDVRVPLSDTLDLAGRMDLVRPDDRIVEFKTAHRQPFGTREHLLQLAAYAFAYERMHGVRPHVSLVTMVASSVPEVIVRNVRVSDNDRAFFVATAHEVVRGITAKVFPPTPGALCTHCPFAALCAQWDGRAANDNASAE